MPDRRRQIFEELKTLTTEQRNPRTQSIDLGSTETILALMNDEDHFVPDAVRKTIPQIAAAVELGVRSLKNGGRLIYVGAGTSGRLGILDSAECPPTFGVPPEMVVGLIAGGRDTVFLSREGVEDSEQTGEEDIRAHSVSARDTVIGITASRRTPYVIGALRAAGTIGASTVLLTCNPKVHAKVDVEINAVVGPETVTGSTRLKAGTAQKLILNMISTTCMIKLGKVYENLMVDLRPTSEKLEERAKGIIAMVTGFDYVQADRIYSAAGKNVKVAVLMAKSGLDRTKAEAALEKADGFLARALGERE